jgi:Flp pilus assembly pilin Flp
MVAPQFDEPEGIEMRMPAMRNKQFGQGMTEYIIIVALIAVAAIAVTQLFGSTIRNQMAGIAQEVAGGDGQTAINAAGTAANNAATKAATAKTLSTYGGNAAEGR